MLLFMVLLSVPPKNNFTLLNYFDGEYLAYTSTPISPEYIFTGSAYINYGKVDVKELIGESLTIKNLEVGAALKTLNARVIYSENLASGAMVIYAYSPKIHKNVKFNNKKVNLQIAVYNDYSVVGWPLILGSF